MGQVGASGSGDAAPFRAVHVLATRSSFPMIGPIPAPRPPADQRSLVSGGRALAVAEIAAFLLPLAVLPCLTRSLGIHSYGRLQTALALGSFAGLVANPGLGTVILRRSARRPRWVARLASRVQPLRFGCAVLAGGGLLSVGHLLSWSDSLLTLCALQALVLTVQALSVDPYLIGLGETTWVGYARALSLLLYSAGVLVWVHDPDDAPIVLCVTLGSTVVFAIAGNLRLRRIWGGRRWAPRWRTTRLLLGESISFGVASVMSLVYARIDVLFLRAFQGEAAVGLYSAAVRITEGIYGVLNVILGSLYPRSITVRAKHPHRGDALAQQALRLAAALVVPFAAGAAVAGGPFLGWLAGSDYARADVVVGVLGAVTLAGMSASIYTAFGLTARGLGRSVLSATAVGAIVNASLNFVAVPLWGAAGAAGTTLLAQAAVAVTAARLTRPPLRVSWLRAVLPWLGPTSAMSVVVVGLRLAGTSAPVLVGGGIATYLVSLLIFRSLSRSERRGLRRLIPGLAASPR